MKTITLELNEQAYPQVVNFLHSLPENFYHIMENDEDSLSPEEYSAVKAIQAKLHAGDESDFMDWDDFKDKV